MGVEVASIYATLTADVVPLETALATADAGLTALAEQAAVTTDVVAGIGAGAATAAEGLGAYDVETGMALTGTQGLTAAMAEFDVAAAATAAAEAGVTAAEAEAAAMGWQLTGSQAELAAANEQLAVSDALAAGATETMTAAMDIAQSAAMGLAAAGIAIAVAVGASKVAYDNTVGSADTLAASIHKLQFETGASATDASKLAYAADVTGISVDQLSRGINIATRALATNKSLGIEPNIDGLATLSDMYLKIEDPIQRNAFLLHEFGRSGADLAPLMALGSAGIKALGDQAALTGNILSQQSVEQFHAYDMQVNQLALDVKGLGVAMGVELAPAATKIVDGGLNLVHTFDVLNAAEKDGIITAVQHRQELGALALGIVSLKDVYDEFAPKVQQVGIDMANGADASDRAAAAAKALADSMASAGAPVSEMSDRVAIMTEANRGATQGERDLADAAAKATQALSDQIGQYELSAGMAGNVTKAQDAYGAAVEADAPKLAKLNEEMAKLVAGQGQAWTATTAAKYSQDDYSLAMLKAGDAAKALADYTGTNQEKLLGLKIAFEDATKKASDMGTQMGTTTSGIADNTTKIAALKAQIDPLVAAEDKAHDAIGKAAGALEYQALAADKNISTDALTKIAHGLGLISDADYALATATEVARKKFDEEIAAGVPTDVALFHMTNTVDALQFSTVHASDVIPALTQHINDAAGMAHGAQQDVEGLGRDIDALHDKTVNIYANIINSTTNAGAASGHNYVDANGVYHYAAGGDFIVPAGYNENFPIGPGGGASSGERVTITPAGQKGPSGGNTYVTINDKLTGALYLESMRQSTLARHEALR